MRRGLPPFDLRYRLDDGAGPSRVTVFSTPTDDHVERTWITVNRADTVPLAAVRGTGVWDGWIP